jgi:hypothetical protein
MQTPENLPSLIGKSASIEITLFAANDFSPSTVDAKHLHVEKDEPPTLPKALGK